MTPRPITGRVATDEELAEHWLGTPEDRAVGAQAVERERRRRDEARLLEHLSPFDRELILVAYKAGRDAAHRLYADAVGPAAETVNVAALNAAVKARGREVDLALPEPGDAAGSLMLRSRLDHDAVRRATRLVAEAARRAREGLELADEGHLQYGRRILNVAGLEDALAEELASRNPGWAIPAKAIARDAIAGVLGIPRGEEPS